MKVVEEFTSNIGCRKDVYFYLDYLPINLWKKGEELPRCPPDQRIKVTSGHFYQSNLSELNLRFADAAKPKLTAKTVVISSSKAEASNKQVSSTLSLPDHSVAGEVSKAVNATEAEQFVRREG
ncbi:hypothetical protein TorRG33x02_351450 [Trema orientale]|uniref:Uncharacterized protein n=1 Tax=Trema orientale TaxID=63057 RepID=A0A2P5AFT9_TREOI|nr:hypothetical protein TorRG33x02_351450 [Trema orientale]